ncbi:MAG: uridine kinase [Lachnospiraceae bacterium]|nr:uridine kinase [Lachnospiraceae bacterium]
MDNVLVIGIAGGTGSGKTTITKKLLARFEQDISVIYHDNYYKAHHEMTYEERTQLNYDHPEALDTHLLVAALKELKQGRSVECPVYDFSIHDRTDQTTTIHPTKVLIVEGILIFADPDLCQQMDIKIFVDTDADVRILRRIIRDVKKRGRSLDSVVSQYLNTVKPMHEQFVEPSKRNADIIIPEGGRNLVALDMLMERVNAHLQKDQERNGNQ